MSESEEPSSTDLMSAIVALHDLTERGLGSLSVKIDHVEGRLDRFQNDVNRRFDRVDERFDRLESRVERLERNLAP